MAVAHSTKQPYRVATPSQTRTNRLGWRHTGPARMDDVKREYLESYQAWQNQLQALHRILLQGEKMEPPKLKGLLNREARAKERYEQARRRLLGLSEET